MSDEFKKYAKEIVDLANQADSALHKTLKIAEKIMPDSEFLDYKEKVASIMVSIQTDMLRPVIDRNPELDKFGYFRKK